MQTPILKVSLQPSLPAVSLKGCAFTGGSQKAKYPSPKAPIKRYRHTSRGPGKFLVHPLKYFARTRLGYRTRSILTLR